MKDWKIIKSNNDVEEIIQRSFSKSQIIFKHSVTCGISAFAKSRLVEGSEYLISADFNYLDLLEYRSISNFIAEKLGVIHQSPQIITLKNGVVTYVVTHHSIDPVKIADNL